MAALWCVMWYGVPHIAYECKCGERIYIPDGATVTPNPAQRQPKLKGMSV